MLLEPSGKELFMVLCKQLNKLKLVIDTKKTNEGTSMESVSFYFHKDIQLKGNSTNVKRQVATVQFNGGKKRIINNEVTGVTLRLYLGPIEVFSLDSILNNHIGFRSQKKGPASSPYYDYFFDSPYSSKDVHDSINALFSDLHEGFINTLNPIQDGLPLEKLPENIKELPRY